MAEDTAKDFSDDQTESGSHGPSEDRRREGWVVMTGVTVTMPVRMAMRMGVTGTMAMLMGIVVGGTGNCRGVRFASHKGIVRAEGRACSQRSYY